MKKKKVSIIGTVGVPALYGGFETLVEYLTKHLNSKLDLTVYCSYKAYKEKKTVYNGAKLKYLPMNANGIQSIPYDITSMLLSLRSSDVILILGVSGCIALPLIKKISKTSIIVNIDGLEWKRDKWNKYAKKFLKYSEKLAVKYSDHVITDNKVIQEYVKGQYGKDSILIPYGADHVSQIPLSKDTLRQFPFLTEKYSMSVCRIEPENNIHLILEAFSQIPDQQLVIVGNWMNSDYGKTLKNKYQKFENIKLLEPIYDQHKLNQIRSNCYIYLHGHSAGGTNPSLVEAMYLGLPILSYDVNYNRATTEDNAIYFKSSNDIISFLSEYLDESTLEQCALKMKKSALSLYTWSSVSALYLSVCDSITKKA